MSTGHVTIQTFALAELDGKVMIAIHVSLALAVFMEPAIKQHWYVNALILPSGLEDSATYLYVITVSMGGV